MNKWLHFSIKPITSIKETDKQNKFGLKPNGLWFSLDNDWKDWCSKEGFMEYDDNLTYTYELTLDESQFYVIDSFEKLLEFEAKYKFGRYINWVEVSEDYDGLIFKNYHKIKKKLRLEDELFNSLWYYSIDVNGGVVWNPSSVKEFVLLNK